MNNIRNLIFLWIFQCGLAKDTLPVFLIDHDQVMGHLFIEPNPFSRTGSLMFSDIVDDAMKHCSVFIIFVEDQFCTEDVSGKDDNGTPFANLHEDIMKYKVKYIPNVVNPISILTRMLEPTHLNVYLLKPGQKFQSAADLKYFYVFFKDSLREETRIETLRRHDAAIHEIYETTRKVTNGAVVALYTGKTNPITVTDFDFRSGVSSDRKIDDNQGVYLGSEGALFRFIGINMETAEHSTYDLFDVPVVVSEMRSESHKSEYQRTNIVLKGVEIQFAFRFSDDFWFLDNVTLIERGEEVGSTVMDLRVPIGNSYYCDEPLTIVNKNDKSFVNIPAYQIQPFRPLLKQNMFVPNAPEFPKEWAKFLPKDFAIPTDLAKLAALIESVNQTIQKYLATLAAKKLCFDIPVRCYPYFSIPTLTGLFVSAICLSILMVGLAFLINIQTNDRFDDPNGKPLIISTDG